ncbi:endolytic transglycosylase MltG [Bacillaceae bacterium SIJ1]|uniref:endolytic transglycosylase MltG n=1 Tax=Litoribacterium kuwaitense TaxID=1398745 RepID=UPI0013ECC60E|nr:endolytic transglycosylase MltG [Litoribacterium kuwaitense]NGP43462.1 endolytic transglycosylase MltG [Litoribacterium kuwaitense]
MDESTMNHKKDLKQRRIKEAGTVRKIVSVLFAIFIIGVVCLVIGGYVYIKSSLTAVAPESDEIIDVSIPIGSTAGSIGHILEDNGLIKDATVFKYYVRYKNEQGFQAGDYQLSPSMNVEGIISQLKTGTVIQEPEFKMTVPEGYTVIQIAEIMSKHVDHSPEDIIQVMDDPETVKYLQEKYPQVLPDDIFAEDVKHPLEGYLYPATYSFYESTPTVEAMLEKMVSQTHKVVSRFQPHDEYSLHEWLTFASLVEKEATAKVDRHKIAGVFQNRLDTGMPLQTDPTVLYALERHQVRIYLDDLAVESPYNTYQNQGLPPGPISNAGMSSLEAAMNPEETDSFYFYARPNGEVLFSETLNEHNTIKNQYQSEWEAVQENQSSAGAQ